MREARGAKGLKQAELADRIGIRPMKLWRYESGRVSRPDADVLQRLARELGVTVEYLLTGEQSASPDTAVGQ